MDARTSGRLHRWIRIATWIDRHRRAIIALSGLVLAASGVVAARLPVYGDFSHLLPPGAPSVVQLHELEGRVESFGAVMIAVESTDPAARDRAADALHARLLRIDPALIAKIDYDDHDTREWIWKNRFLFASLADLQQARDALRDRVRRAKLSQNPLYVDLAADERPSGDDPATQKLRDKLAEAEKKHDAPRGFISKDGRMRLVIVRTKFDSAAIALSERLVSAIQEAAATTAREVPGVTITPTSDVYSALAEHRAVLHGMLLAILVTVGLVTAALLLYYRSLRTVAILMWALMVGTAVTFALTKLLIGHLNLATAFLSSIVVGNGINFGIILAARYLEEWRAGRRGVEAIGTSMAGTLHGTLAAALTGAIAYGSLVLTDFRGFRHFGVIGGLGMILCWLATYLVMPAGLAILERQRFRTPREPAIGRVLARLLPKRPALVVTISLFGLGVAAVLTGHFFAHDPWESDIRHLRSDNAELRAARASIARIDDAFGNDLTGGYVIATHTRDGARTLLLHLRQHDADRPPNGRLFQYLRGLDDVLPADQQAKLELFREIRKLCDDALPDLEGKDREDVARLRPPEDLRELRDEDVPADLAAPFTEKDGARGRVILADASDAYDTWNIKDLVRYAGAVRGLDLGPDVAFGGSTFVYADVLASASGDGPRATLAAALGAILVVLLLVGAGRYGAVTIVCGVAGTLWMLALAMLTGLQVNFLDFVALPITIGIGIDYAVNLAARVRDDGPDSVRGVLATTGGAVALCSFTTMVGYGSLLLSASGGIRSFGAAATLGELTCLTTALTLAPAALALLGSRRTRG
jgi:predicted RND superfamily exporter protein